MGFNTRFSLESIGDTIRELRKEANISQSQIQQRSGILRFSISKIENHAVMPDIDTLIRIGDALNVPAWQILKLVQQKMELEKADENRRIIADSRIRL